MGREAKGVTLIIGLGNPGDEYERTRHNAGASLLSAFAASQGLLLKPTRAAARVAKLVGEKADAVLAIPTTFMNDSGRAAAFLTKRFKTTPGSIMVCYDDIDLPFGTIRIGINNSSGGHNGIKSIIEHLSSTNFIRFRIGIGPRDDAAERFVLRPFSASERAQLPTMHTKGSALLDTYIKEGLDTVRGDHTF